MRTGSLTGSPTRIVILRSLHLGDLLCAVPAWRALRRAFPEASITLIGLPWAEAFVQRFGACLDGFIPFPGYPGFPEQQPALERIPAFLRRVQRERFDLALQMQGSGEISNPLVQLFGARRTAGFYQPGQYCPDPRFYFPYPHHETEVWRHLRLMEHLGLPLQGDDLEFPLYAADWEEARGLLQARGLLPGAYVCVHPGARAVERRWPPERFASLVDGLSARGLQVVLTGSSDEAGLAQQVAAAAQTPPVDLTGATSLGGLAAVLSLSRLLVSNDTGVSHLSAAVRTPSVVLFSASDPRRWAPLNRVRHRVVTAADRVTDQIVLQQVDDLLREVHAGALS